MCKVKGGNIYFQQELNKNQERTQVNENFVAIKAEKNNCQYSFQF